jgi:prophage antirepressor-like protein
MSTALIRFAPDAKINALVRVVNINGEPWFVAKDVAETLGYANPSRSVSEHCKALKKLNTTDLVGLGVRDTPPSGLLVIPERDVYRLIMRSKLPAAEAS